MVEKVLHPSIVHEKLYEKNKQGQIQSRWWLADPDDMYLSVRGVTDNIYLHQSWHRILNLRHARLYSNNQLIGLLSRYYAPTAASLFNGERITLNVVKSCIDTVGSKIAQQSPRPYILTTDADDRMQRKGKLLQQYIDGVFQHSGVYRIGPRCFTDCCVFGTGIMKIYVENDEICVERVLCSDILVDDIEGAYERPRQIHEQKFVDREVLCALYPDKADLIRKATDTFRPGAQTTSAADQLLVTESWHLPSGPDADDGVHAWTISNCTLMSVPYTKSYFPFAVIRWSPAVMGWFGDGLAFELTGIHREIQRLVRTIQMAQHRVAGPRILVQKGTSVNVADLGNNIAQAIYYSGTPPTFETSPAMPMEIYQHLNTLITQAYQISGISQINASGGKPDAELSGRALQTLQDVQTERFALCNLRYENFYIDIAKIVVDLAKDLYEQKQVNMQVNVPDDRNKFVRRIKWSEVNLDADKYEMAIFPTSLLPTTPAGKLQAVIDMHQANLLNNNEAMKLLDYPDVEAVTSLDNAAYDDAMRIIDNIIEDGKYSPPDQYMNFQLTLQLAHSNYLKAKDNNVPADRLDLLQRFLDDLADLMQAATPPAPPAAPAPGPAGKPIAAPQPPPQSPLVPFASAQ